PSQCGVRLLEFRNQVRYYALGGRRIGVTVIDRQRLRRVRVIIAHLDIDLDRFTQALNRGVRIGDSSGSLMIKVVTADDRREVSLTGHVLRQSGERGAREQTLINSLIRDDD